MTSVSVIDSSGVSPVYKLCGFIHRRRAEKAIKSRRMHNGLVRRKWQLMRKANPHLPVRTPMWWKKKFHCKFKYGIHPEAVVMMPHYDDRLYFGGRPKHKYWHCQSLMNVGCLLKSEYIASPVKLPTCAGTVSAADGLFLTWLRLLAKRLTDLVINSN